MTALSAALSLVFLTGVFAVTGSAAPASATSVETVCTSRKQYADLAVFDAKTTAFRAYASTATFADSNLVSLYDSGVTFQEFLAEARLRRDGWLKLAESATVLDDLVSRANAVEGRWRLLAVVYDGCGDSMNQVPFVATLAASVAGLELRVVNPGQGRAVREAHRSLDGRIATPTYVLIDGTGQEAGCVVELPTALRHWANAARQSGVSLDSIHSYQRTFYEADRGVAITTEIVEMLEAAAAGNPRCERGNAS